MIHCLNDEVDLNLRIYPQKLTCLAAARFKVPGLDFEGAAMLFSPSFILNIYLPIPPPRPFASFVPSNSFPSDRSSTTNQRLPQI